MTAVVGVGVWVPEGRVGIEEVGGELGLSGMQVKIFRRYHRLGEIARDPHGGLAELLRGALDGLDALRGQEHRVRYVLHARTFPTVVPYPHDPVREVCDAYGLGHAAVFAVGHHACASGLLALDAAGRLLAAEGDHDGLALVLTGEKTFTAEARLVPGTSFFGEGAAACLVAATGERDRLLAYASDLRGDIDSGDEEAALAFQRVYADTLAATITAAVARAGLAMDDVGVVLPHNVNRVAWHQVCRTLGYPRERVVLDNVAATGHLFCADSFVNYRTAQARGLLRQGEPYVMAAAGAGSGAAFSAMAFVH
ncbi:3-oxoacyl-[acyl-carrier-protein] synthase III C-terminal domain-containing protein [Actinacidiphila bryophytorum]|uniref:3-oxoacyl-(Acyl-carrier-protein) synthase-3 n=2 Tax=Actinacidiphila bryophytorum TaxID=1436133 RepID=A0A9W4H148_9ACTN|nr:3-oxoacyl-[acyl-carrier-protein] synthase III C-terminal domain-containing protein [Actinacidiphila bryophytorum]MBM9434913.1 3-oxoacyl-ACP synthase [Actinacidiphila bryophytorum]CAG7641266.1 3-oxoacyl-(acyl-carrier-protein) synthase-3 [Actinacidiphila bryophytorum]